MKPALRNEAGKDSGGEGAASLISLQNLPPLRHIFICFINEGIPSKLLPCVTEEKEAEIQIDSFTYQHLFLLYSRRANGSDHSAAPESPLTGKGPTNQERAEEGSPDRLERRKAYLNLVRSIVVSDRTTRKEQHKVPGIGQREL